jgi:hypothetical protein
VTDRRQVRVSDSFFQQLDELFGAERGEDGEPSATDFLVVELPTVIERFARDFDGLPMVIVGVPNGRVLLVTGRLVPVLAVFGVLVSGDFIELVGLTVDQWLDE